MADAVLLDRVPLYRNRFVDLGGLARFECRHRLALRGDQVIPLGVDPETRYAVRLGILADLDQPAIDNLVDIKVFFSTDDKVLAIGMREHVDGKIVKQHAVYHAVIRVREVDQRDHVGQLGRQLLSL